MFSFLAMQKTKRFLFASLVFVLLTGFFTGCGSDSDNGAVDNLLPNGLLGRWVSEWDGYEISRYQGVERIVYISPDFPAFNFEGIIRHVNTITATAGIIIFEFTVNVPDPDRRFSAAAYLELTSASVELSNAFDPIAGLQPLAATLEEAVARFTAGTVGNYFGFFGEYTRENQ